MQVNATSPMARALSSSSASNILLEESHIHWQTNAEKDAFKKLKTRRFVHTAAYDLVLLQATGMDAKLDLVFRAVGWDGFWNIVEQGSKLLTLEFLCTLQITDIGIQFRLFGEEFSSPWKDLSLLLGFNSQCVVDVDHALQDFDTQKF